MVKPFKNESLNLQTFHTLVQLDMNMTLNILALRYKNMMHKNMVLKKYIEKNCLCVNWNVFVGDGIQHAINYLAWKQDIPRIQMDHKEWTWLKKKEISKN